MSLPTRYKVITPLQRDALDAYIAHVIANGSSPTATQLGRIIGVDRTRIYPIWRSLFRRLYVAAPSYPSRPIRTPDGNPFFFSLTEKKL